MSFGHPDLIAAVARERHEAFLREAEQQRLMREAKCAQTRSDAPGWAARVRRTLAFRCQPVHGQVRECPQQCGVRWSDRPEHSSSKDDPAREGGVEPTTVHEAGIPMAIRLRELPFRSHDPAPVQVLKTQGEQHSVLVHEEKPRGSLRFVGRAISGVSRGEAGQQLVRHANRLEAEVSVGEESLEYEENKAMLRTNR